MRSIFYLLSRLANSFVFASNRTKDYYEKFSSAKKKFLNSITCRCIYDPDFEYPIEEFIKSFMKEKKIIIGTVANVSPVKGLSFLLKIVKNLSSLSEKIVFIVVGSVHSTQKKIL